MFFKILMICVGQNLSKEFLISAKMDRKWLKIAKKLEKKNKQKMYIRFQRIALDVYYGFGKNRSMFVTHLFS